MARGETVIVAGLGWRSGVDGDEIVALVRAAVRAAGVMPAGLAVLEAKAGEPGVIVAAARLDLPLIPVGFADLAAAQSRCVTRSARAVATIGVASVAEGCALAAAGNSAVLLAPRLTGRHATCAIAGEGRR
ncbi:cobalamin biosynthesis protein [Acidiphilium sp.]|uniref:cobalamin biosynthesis protein n=1 Tax=Acidiphilium sp. TaxID=527 RepID=UPI003D083C08